jgi:hypothetical protein
VVRVTAGPLKADVAFVLSGAPTIAVATETAWKDALPLLQAIGPQRVELAFDMDREREVKVKEQLGEFRLRLIRGGYTTRPLSWDASHKGLDDALKAGVPLTGY